MPAGNLVGKTFNCLTVIERDLSRKSGAAYWLCECSCGNPELYSARASDLRSGKTWHCNKCKPNKTKNIDTSSIVGQRFERLVVLERDMSKPVGHSHPSYWICKCDCGNTISAAKTGLLNKTTKSCGCLKSELQSKRQALDLTDKRFGKLIALKNTFKLSNHHSYYWICQCDCGNIKEIPAESLSSGRVNSCGECGFSSKGEEIIKNILEENNILYYKEFTFSDLKGKNNQRLRFDFAIFNENNTLIRLIEFDGEQHFKEAPLFKDTLAIRQERDQRKNDYAKEHGIPLIRIPYYDINNITLDSLIGDKYLI